MVNKRNVSQNSRKNYRPTRPAAADASPTASVNKISGVLPSPAALESYEEIVPGMSAELMAMVKREQKHRHDWEMKYLKLMGISNRIGQLLSFSLAIIILYFAVLFTTQGSYNLAITTVIAGFTFLAAVNIITFYARNFHTWSKVKPERKR